MKSLLLRAHDDSPDHWQDGSGGAPLEIDRARTAKVGLRVFLAMVSSLFLLFLVAFIIRSQIPDWQPLTAPTAPLAHPTALWLNSALLFGASIALQCARLAARHDRAKATLLAFALGGALAVAFIAGQARVWQQFDAWGYAIAGNPANSFFYLLTGLHALHLLGGLIAWGKTLSRLLLGEPLAELRGSIELCASYWHYLLGLWLLLFALLTSTPETYQAIAAFCGLR